MTWLFMEILDNCLRALYDGFNKALAESVSLDLKDFLLIYK